MKKVGVLGGMGPKATIYFCDMVIENTNASCDQEHLDMIVSNHASIPDRTAFLDGHGASPVPYLIKDAKMLEACGCDFLVLTCNTSHFAYDDITREITLPLVNMPKETCDIINRNPSIHKVGLMATEGTIKAHVYEKYLQKEIYYPDDTLNKEVMSLIYDKVKKGLKVPKEEFMEVLDKFFQKGCDMVIMGCTELSVIVRDNDLYHDRRIIDAMKVLVDKTIELSNN